MKGRVDWLLVAALVALVLIVLFSLHCGVASGDPEEGIGLLILLFCAAALALVFA
jgi:hypothetical protein